MDLKSRKDWDRQRSADIRDKIVECFEKDELVPLAWVVEYNELMNAVNEPKTNIETIQASGIYSVIGGPDAADLKKHLINVPSRKEIYPWDERHNNDDIKHL